jgi:AraC-like DNA-binding protein
MQVLEKGRYFGLPRKSLQADGLLVTVTEYTLARVDWHYHRNAYFTFLLAGNLAETSKRRSYHYSPGTLVFHHWQEPHWNAKAPGSSRGLHVELESPWWYRYDLNPDRLAGSIHLEDPSVRLCFWRLCHELWLEGVGSGLAIEAELIAVVGKMDGREVPRSKQKPRWVDRLKELLHERYDESLSLETLAREVGVHPVHLCRDFSRHFQMTLGAYLRSLRVERAASLISGRRVSLASVAYQCGFADQSHFIRCFKKRFGVTPRQFQVTLYN